MDIKGLIQIAVTLAALAISSGNLPEILHIVNLAKIHLLRDSQASNWEQATLLDLR